MAKPQTTTDLLVEVACSLYNEIGPDLEAACGLGKEDAYPEPDEVADCIRDRMADYLQENEPTLFAAWKLLTYAEKIAICTAAM